MFEQPHLQVSDNHAVSFRSEKKRNPASGFINEFEQNGELYHSQH